MHAIIVASKTFFKDNIILAIKDIKQELEKHNSQVYFGMSDSQGRCWLIDPGHRAKDIIIEDLRVLENKIANCEI